MTGLEALDTLIFTFKQLVKIVPANELPGLLMAIEAADAVRKDVNEEE